MNQHIRQGAGAVRPYLWGPVSLPTFLKEVFGAEELERHELGPYVPDVDATYERAVKLGAASISAPADKPYQERQAGFRDAAGNTWWIATYIG